MSKRHADRFYCMREINGLCKFQKSNVVPQRRMIFFVLVVYDSVGNLVKLIRVFGKPRHQFVHAKMYDAFPVAIVRIMSTKFKYHSNLHDG